MTNQPFVDVIKREEGFRHHAYRDSLGRWTIGHGIHHITEAESECVVRARVEAIEEDMMKIFGAAWVCIDDVRQAALISMHYQLGPGGFRGFKKMIAAVLRAVLENDEAAWEDAERECLDSKAAKMQTPERFARNAYALGTGSSPWKELS